MPQHKQDDIMKKLGPPKLFKAEPRFTTAQLVKGAWKGDRERSKKCAVRSVRIVQTPKSPKIEKDAVIYEIRVFNKDNKHTHTVTVFYPKGKYGARQRPRVDCNCPRHVYYFEYALAKKYGNAYLWRCLNERPDVTNPRQKMGICKHTILALQVLNRRYKSGKLPKKATKRSRKMGQTR